jgi:hypothetical protein
MLCTGLQRDSSSRQSPDKQRLLLAAGQLLQIRGKET